MIGPSDEELESKYRKWRGQIFIGVGAGCLLLAYLIFFKTGQFTVRLSGRVVGYHRVDYPTAFNLAAAAVLLVGVYHLIQGVLFIFSNGSIGKEATPAGSNSVFWRIFNAAVLILFFSLGYVGIPLEILRGTNPKWVLCISGFVVVALITFSRLHFAAVSTFRRPRWGRSPLNWAHDPLQVPFVETFWWMGLVLGTVSHLFISHLVMDSTAVWSVFVCVAVVAGLLVGQVAAYAAYRDRIGS